jgi:phenylacetate-CoA ligase
VIRKAVDVAPPGKHLDLMHRLRRAHPAGALMRRSLATMERATPTELRSYQERRLRMLVRLVAARSPFYRRWFAESGVDPGSIRTLDDLGRLPLLTRADVMADPAAFAVAPLRTMWAAHSSGTSGRVVTVYRTPGSSAYEQAALQRQWGWFGLGRDARRAVLRGSGFAADGDVTREVPGDRQLLVSSFHLDAQHLPEVLAALRRFRPDAIEGWPSSIALLAALLRDAGATLPLTAVVTSSEVMSPGQVALMRQVYGGPVVDHYGQTERVALAGNCERGGYHVFSDYGITELLPVEGAPGRREIVGTPLHNWGFPLLRYRTGDEVLPAEGDRCPCGRPFPLIGSIDGRIEDSFVAADGRIVPLPGSVVDDLAGLAEAQIAQLAPGRFEVRMVPGAGFDREAAIARATRTVDRSFGPGQDLRFTVMDRIPRSPSGKLRSAIVLDASEPVAPRHPDAHRVAVNPAGQDTTHS